MKNKTHQHYHNSSKDVQILQNIKFMENAIEKLPLTPISQWLGLLYTKNSRSTAPAAVMLCILWKPFATQADRSEGRFFLLSES